MYTCGEDGYVRAWKMGDGQEQGMEVDEEEKGKKKERKEKRREKKEKKKGEEKRFKPY
jgi:hypothetical protein